MNLLVAILLVGGFTACKEDKKIEEKEGLPVADGFYMTKDGEDPVATAVLKPEQVDGPGISGMEREGFLQGYMYLTAGNYNLVEVVDKQAATILGGTLTKVSGADAHNDECGGDDNTEYSLVAAVADGASFAVPANGFYVVAYDATLSEIVFDQLTSVSIIGTATPGGWGEGTQMTTTVTETGLSAVLEGVTLKEDVFKFRFNCRWAIDRRLDVGQDFDNANGYSFWTNFGGSSIDLLVAGNRSDGGNIPVAEYAVYTVTFDWNAVDGFTASLTKTGEAEPLPEYPTAMYLTGDATHYGWAEPATDALAAMTTVTGGVDGVFYKILYLEGGLGFKISAAGWSSPNLGFADVDSYDGDGETVSDNGGNMSIATSGMYTVVLDLRDDMTKVSVRPTVVYGIGNTFGSWDAMVEANKYTVDNVAKTVTSPAATADGDIRSYVSHAWLTGATDGDWWHAEFKPIDGVITYRTGDELAASNITAGQVVTYTFDTNSGAIN